MVGLKSRGFQEYNLNLPSEINRNLNLAHNYGISQFKVETFSQGDVLGRGGAAPRFKNKIKFMKWKRISNKFPFNLVSFAQGTKWLHH